MSWMCHGRTNVEMISKLQEYGILKSKAAAAAMRQIDRADYVVDKKDAYIDSPQPIGHKATISAPHMHAYCLDYLSEHLKPGMSALDVGSGSGYLAAIFGLMVGDSGKVVGVEHIPELVERSIESIKKGPAVSLLEKGTLSIHDNYHAIRHRGARISRVGHFLAPLLGKCTEVNKWRRNE